MGITATLEKNLIKLKNWLFDNIPGATEKNRIFFNKLSIALSGVKNEMDIVNLKFFPCNGQFLFIFAAKKQDFYSV